MKNVKRSSKRSRVGRSKGRGKSRRKRRVARGFPEWFLLAVGWLFVPFIMLVWEWRKLGNFGRFIGLIWTVVFLYMVFGHKVH